MPPSPNRQQILDKDRDALAWLERMLDEQGLDREEILRQVWSYTPFWVRKGYSEYAAPVAAWPGAPDR